MIKLIKWILLTIIGLLPDSPFTGIIGELSASELPLDYFNWFLPVDIVLVLIQAWISCMGLYLIFVIVKEIIVKLILKKITGLIGIVGSILGGGD
ncbi:MAG: hypothetical protein HFI51_04425 [Lachnospiraceae bacterium]|jgi:hypothetical protein|nr:hypothetical protein [Lachnospiraceae bacterium]